MSTADSILLALSSITVRGILEKTFELSLPENKTRPISRLLCVVVIAIAVVCVLNLGAGIVKTALKLIWSGYYMLLGPALMMLFWDWAR